MYWLTRNGARKYDLHYTAYTHGNEDRVAGDGLNEGSTLNHCRFWACRCFGSSPVELVMLWELLLGAFPMASQGN